MKRDHYQATDQTTKALLDDLGVDYEELTIRLAAIDRAKSMNNQARSVAIDEDVVLAYAEAKQAGDIFPRIIVVDDGKTVYAIGGNHRIEADRLNDTTEARAFLVKKPTPAQIQTIAIEDNRLHGKRLTREDSLRHAVELVRQYGMTHVAAAKRLRIPPTAVSTYMARLETEARLARMGLPPVTGKHIDRLSSIKSDEVFKAVRLRLSPSMGTTEFSRAVARVNRCRSEAEALELVDAMADLRADQERRVAGTTRGAKTMTAYKAVILLANHAKSLPSNERLRSMSDGEQRKCRELLSDTAQRIDVALEALNW